MKQNIFSRINIQLAKRIIVLSLIFFFASYLLQVSYGTGIIMKDNKDSTRNRSIVFWKYTLNEAKTKAKEEKKLIFVDLHYQDSDHSMRKRVFSDSVVADYYNQMFICLRMDAFENEGKKLKNKYKIAGFPAYLFFDENGELIHADCGITDLKDTILFRQTLYPSTQKYFLEYIGKVAVNPLLRLSTQIDAYEKGVREFPVIDTLYKRTSIAACFYGEYAEKILKMKGKNKK